jgi:hypothetical protein
MEGREQEKVASERAGIILALQFSRSDFAECE